MLCVESRSLLKTGSLIPRCHGHAPWSLTLAATVAASVKLHGASPWHLQVLGCSSQKPFVCPSPYLYHGQTKVHPTLTERRRISLAKNWRRFRITYVWTYREVWI